MDGRCRRGVDVPAALVAQGGIPLSPLRQRDFIWWHRAWRHFDGYAVREQRTVRRQLSLLIARSARSNERVKSAAARGALFLFTGVEFIPSPHVPALPPACATRPWSSRSSA